MWHEMADTRITLATPKNEKEVKLPANNLIDFKKKIVLIEIKLTM